MLIIFDLPRPKSDQTPDKTTRTVNSIRFNDLFCGMDFLGLCKQKINLVLSL